MGMAALDFADKASLCRANICEGLTVHRIACEVHEIDRMPGLERDTYLAILFETTNAAAMARARVNDHIGAAGVVDGDAFGRQDAQ